MDLFISICQNLTFQQFSVTSAARFIWSSYCAKKQKTLAAGSVPTALNPLARPPARRSCGAAHGAAPTWSCAGVSRTSAAQRGSTCARSRTRCACAHVSGALRMSPARTRLPAAASLSSVFFFCVPASATPIRCQCSELLLLWRAANLSDERQDRAGASRGRAAGRVARRQAIAVLPLSAHACAPVALLVKLAVCGRCMTRAVASASPRCRPLVPYPVSRRRAGRSVGVCVSEARGGAANSWPGGIYG